MDYKVLYHSSIVLNNTLYVDPYKVNIDPHNAEFVFITHSHYDHFSLDDIKKVMNENTYFVVPHEARVSLLKIGVPETKITVVLPNNAYYINGLAFSTIPAYNVLSNFHPKMNDWLGYVFDFDGEKVAILGDTDITEENKDVKCDILFVPIGGTYTLNATEAAELTNIINPKKVIPVHYNALVGTQVDAETFKQNVNPDIVVDIIL